MSTVNKAFTQDLLALPAFLKEQAKQGLFFKRLRSAWVVLEQGEPQELDFCLLPVNNNDEYNRIKDLSGWSIVRQIGEFLLICAPSGTPLEIICDRDVCLVKLGFMRTMYMVRFLLASLGLAFSGCAVFTYWNAYRWLSVLCIVLCAVLAVYLVLELLPLLRLQKTMRTLIKRGST